MKSVIMPLSKALREGKLSSQELTKKYLKEIEMRNGELNAFISLTPEKALLQAEGADRLIAEGKGSILTGIPMSLKDNICSKGDLTTCASKILEGYRPMYNATAWDKLEKQGAVLLGKTNMDEFAMGSSCETGCYGAARNPWNIKKTAGGSSGGGAAAVSAGLCAYSVGSDTGGSVRMPASYCGIVGLKPTYGTVSRYGLVAYASSLDQIGIMADSVSDAAAVFEAICGRDKNDMTSADYAFTADSIYTTELKSLRIGVISEELLAADADAQNAVRSAAKAFADYGCAVDEVSIPELSQMLSVYYIIACAEASSNLGRYDGIRYGRRAKNCGTADELIIKSRSEGFGDEVKRRIMLGTYVLSQGYYDRYYKKACALRASLIDAFDKVFEKYDVLLAPSTVSTAFDLGGNLTPAERYRSDITSVPVNITGVPALSVPVCLNGEALPLGVQLIGKRFDEKTVLSAGLFAEENISEIPERKGGVSLEL